IIAVELVRDEYENLNFGNHMHFNAKNQEQFFKMIDTFRNGIRIETLQEIVNIVSYYFQYHGYPSATAYIPQQEITDSIQINIMLG
ncbi:hypothetical protein VWM73_11075, partial [Campylobacter coli]